MNEINENGIIDYIFRFGNSTFDEYKFREADVLVLTQMSYIQFEGNVSDSFHERIKIKDAILKVLRCDKIAEQNPQTIEFMKQLCDSKRFGELELCGCWYASRSDDEPVQFSAITVKVFDELYFISYRGTDGTVHGWKEDFLFSCRKQTLAQKSAKIYLESSIKELSDNDNIRFIVSGHSKGGNLAAYASIFTDERIQNRIIKIYCNDAPGFNEKQNFKSLDSYRRLHNKIVCIQPQCSYIGHLMYTLPDEDNYLIVESSNKGIWQHDLFSWIINEDGSLSVIGFKKTEDSPLMCLVNSFIFNTPYSKREPLINKLFSLLETDGSDKELFRKLTFELDNDTSNSI